MYKHPNIHTQKRLFTDSSITKSDHDMDIKRSLSCDMLAVMSDDDARLVVVAKDDSCFSLLFNRSKRLLLSRLHTLRFYNVHLAARDTLG